MSQTEVTIERTARTRAQAEFLQAETKRLSAERAYQEEVKRGLEVMAEIEALSNEEPVARDI